MVDPVFAPHGRYVLQWRGDVLFAQLIGTFNTESMTNYVHEVMHHAQSRPVGPWGRIVDLRFWDGMTPDVVHQFEELAAWLRTTSCVISVQVFSEAFFQKIAARVADQVSAPNLSYAFDMESAIELMKKHGLHVGDETDIRSIGLTPSQIHHT